MKNRLPILIVALVLVLAPSTTLAQVTQTGKAYKLRMAWKKGDVYKYRIELKIDMPNGKSMPTSGDVTLKVIDVKAGVADVEIESTNMASKTPTKQKLKMDSLGQIGDLDGMSGISSQRLPEKSIKIGESWSMKRKVNQGGVEMDVLTIYTLKAVKAVNGIKCAVLEVKATTTKGFITDTGGTMLLEAKNGQMLSLDLLTKITMGTGAQAQSMKSTTTAKRV